MKEDTLLEIVLETKVALTRRRETREADKSVMILQVMKNMF